MTSDKPIRSVEQIRRDLAVEAQARAVSYTYTDLRAWLDTHGHPGDASHGEGTAADVAPGISVHDHPHSGRPRELHFMVDGVKVAELGPGSHDPAYPHEDVEPGYVDLMSEWAGKPVRHSHAKARILADNGLSETDVSESAMQRAADDWQSDSFRAGWLAAVEVMTR